MTKATETYMKVRAGVSENVQTHIPSESIFGRHVSGLRPVAVGVRRGSTWVLVYGVELNELTPKGAIRRADEVARNFWQISWEAAKQHETPPKRIGLVFNGNSHLRPSAADAHAYSLHRLEADAGSLPSTPRRLKPGALIRREVLSLSVQK